ncbi:MAG: rRNA maturation RNase YbeY [Thiotrichales bacterium]|nr:rRNA maturation RNase YbeY [Thiotrichales bacterium]
MNLDLSIQRATAQTGIPDDATILDWLTLVLDGKIQNAGITVRIVEEDESSELNRRYRNKTGPTNVLSFAYEMDTGSDSKLTGDIVICASIVAREAGEQNKELVSHWAHMVIHGTLHLMGYDHESDDDASKMETLECKLMSHLGYPDPYLENAS